MEGFYVFLGFGISGKGFGSIMGGFIIGLMGMIGKGFGSIIGGFIIVGFRIILLLFELSIVGGLVCVVLKFMIRIDRRVVIV